MSTHLLVEAALRAFVMGIILFATLRLFRIQQIRAQRVAWLAALLASFAMPIAVYFHLGPRLLPDMAAKPATTAMSSRQVRPVFFYAIHGGRVEAKPAHREQPEERQPSTRVPYSFLLYLAVSGYLLFRLVFGLVLSLRLRRDAAPIALSSQMHPDVRVSRSISTPVTIASSILLPESFTDWGSTKLEIVLRHEQSHVKRADFYVLLLASMHCAIFWFSPFSWWLQRKLSELGEALSDHAALDAAGSRTSYAETLLEFAAVQRWPLTAVAMARSSSLRTRIERLLSDQLFDESFNRRRALPLLASALVILAAAASTSLVRVRAAERPALPQTTDVATPAAPEAPPPPPAAAEAPLPPPSGAQESDSIGSGSSNGKDRSYSVGTGSYSFDTDSNGDVFAFVRGNEPIVFSGSVHQLSKVEALHHTVSGEFIFYVHSGKSYLVTDPSIIAQAKSIYAPMQELERRQEQLGKQQEELGRQQEALGRLQERVTIATPDLKKELASLVAATAKLRQLQSQPTIDGDALSELQGEIGDIQGRLGELQGSAGEKQGELGEKQGALGVKQGQLGEEEGRIGELQGKIAQEAQHRLTPLIQKAIKDGRVKPID